MSVPRAGRSGLIGLAVALALADSSVVTLALPDMVSRFGVSITDVAWVLISYNLVLAAGAVPAARMVRGRSRLLCVAGLVVFAAASLACGLASSFPVLLAGRCVPAGETVFRGKAVEVGLAAEREHEFLARNAEIAGCPVCRRERDLLERCLEPVG